MAKKALEKVPTKVLKQSDLEPSFGNVTIVTDGGGTTSPVRPSLPQLPTLIKNKVADLNQGAEQDVCSDCKNAGRGSGNDGGTGQEAKDVVTVKTESSTTAVGPIFECCAVCIESFKSGDLVRILPCR